MTQAYIDTFGMSFEKSIRDLLKQKIDDLSKKIVEEAVEEAAKKLRAEANILLASAAIELHRLVSFTSNSHEVLITIKKEGI